MAAALANKDKKEHKVTTCNSDEDFQKFLKDNAGKYVFIDFFATWCGPCVMIAPYIEECAGKDSYKDIAFCKVDVDQCAETSQEYKIQAMPTFILLDKEHKTKKTGKGASKDMVNDILKEAASKDEKEHKVTTCNSDEDFQKFLKDNAGKYVFIDFFATWCGPCVMIAPYIEECAGKDSYKDIAFCKVDVDQCDETSQEYKIQAMPTFILLDKEHKTKKTGKGASKDLVNDILKEAK